MAKLKLRRRLKNKRHDPEQVKAGMRVEAEHTDNAATARKIALDHLDEDPDYYKDWKDKEKILFRRKAPNIKKAYGYVGPMSVADITLASWNEFFREGGSLNQPMHLQNNRLKQIERQYVRLARLHAPL